MAFFCPLQVSSRVILPLAVVRVCLQSINPGGWIADTPFSIMSTPSDIAVHMAGVRLDRSGRTILSGIDLSIPRGQVVAVLGPSGCGKSTLFAALTGELVPASGVVALFGQPVPRARRALLEYRKQLGVLLQGNGLLTDLTAAENIALPLRAHTRLPDAGIERLVVQKLNAVGLAAAADLYPRELSGGMARRIALARAIALDPPLMLYDEPLSGLDPIATGTIINLIAQLNRTLGLTSLIITHHVRETLPIADLVLFIANGHLVFSGTPGALQANTDPLLQQFLHGNPDGPMDVDNRPAPREAA